MYRIVSLLISITLLSCQSTSFVPAADDTLVTNGKILTIDDDFNQVEAMVVRDGAIVYVGDNLSKGGFNTENIIDLEGKVVMPGFIEPHTHPAAAAILYNWADVSGFSHDTAEDAIATLRQKVENTPKGQWVFAFGWDAMLLKGSFPPYREILDEISKDHPIWVMMQSMHTHYFNSYALNLAGITDDIQDPPQGGHYEKDENGRLTGLITESVTLAPFFPHLPQLPENMQQILLRNQYNVYNKAGITTIGITGLIDALLPKAETLIQRISESEDCNLRVFLYRDGAIKGDVPQPETTNENFKYLGNKYWADGSPYTGTMLVKEPYISSDLNDKLSIKPNTFGQNILPQEVLSQLTLRDAAAGLQVAIHAQGDSAMENTLDIYRDLLTKHPKMDHRHRLEHLALIKEEHIKEMAELGLTPSFHINHIYYYGDFLARILGEKSASSFMPIGLAAKYGMKFSLHNDSPMYPAKPLLAVESAVSRKTLNGRPLGPQNAVPIEEALRAITIYPAWQMFAEDRIGSLEVGKKADFVIIEENPLEVEIDDISDLNILEVYVSGKRVYAAE